MTRATSRWMFVTLAGALLAAALGFAWAVGPSGVEMADPRPRAVAPPTSPPSTSGDTGTAAGPPGAVPVDRVFGEYCGGCHTAASLRRRFQSAPDPDALRRRYETFLTEHGDASAEDDRRMLDWLMKAGG